MYYLFKNLTVVLILFAVVSCSDSEEDHLSSVVGYWTGTRINLFKCNDSDVNGAYEGCLIPNTDRGRPCLILDISNSGRYSITNNISGDRSSGSITVTESTMELCQGTVCDEVADVTYTINSSSRNRMEFSYTDQNLGCLIRVSLVRVEQ